MDELVKLKFDLEIPTQKMLSQVTLHNESIEKQIEDGLNKAVKELTENDGLVEMVKVEAKDAITNSIRNSLLHYHFKQKISNVIEDKLIEKLEGYATEVVDKVINDLNKK